MSSTRVAILASGTQSASAQSSGIAVGNLKELGISVSASVVTGSLHALWMQTSSDGGTTWYDMLAESVVNLTTGAASGTTGSWMRSIVPAGSGAAAGALDTGKAILGYAMYRTFGDYVRAAWIITAAANGTVTLKIDGLGKN